MSAKSAITDGRTALGIEFGSTRIKGVLVGPDLDLLASGAVEWENDFADGRWTYPLTAVWDGLAACFAAVADDVRDRHSVELTSLGSLGVSAMMHGYLAFDAAGELLVPFRTWRNTTTATAADRLTELLGFHIPQRWSVAHLGQAVLDGEPHVAQVRFLTTLAGYVHWKLTGEKVLGVGDASGMFPIDTASKHYDQAMLDKADGFLREHGVGWSLRDVRPQVLIAGQPAGTLTQAGARLLDPSGKLRPGAPLCPPEGDAGTGMVATGSLRPGAGNVSVGTSIFAMVVLDRDLTSVHPEIDLVTTPLGDPVAMVHCNNGASELGQWCSLFAEFADAAGLGLSTADVYRTLFQSALAAPDCDGLLAYNFVAGEHTIGLAQGRPLVARTPGSALRLGGFMRAQVFAMFATLRLGMDVLAAEGVRVRRLLAHGGVFATPEVAQRLLAAALGTPVAVPASAPEGGAWGMAVLAAYLTSGRDDLAEYLGEQAGPELVVEPDEADAESFADFLRRFVQGLPIEEAAVAAMPV